MKDLHIQIIWRKSVGDITFGEQGSRLGVEHCPFTNTAVRAPNEQEGGFYMSRINGGTSVYTVIGGNAKAQHSTLAMLGEVPK